MQKSIDIAGSKIFYRVDGAGQAVMLVHGFGETGDVWKNQVEYLKNTCYLIVPDLPGSGRSDLIGDMSMEGIAEVLHAILIAESASIMANGKPAKAVLIGHSMGGYIALAFLEKYESMLKAFGLLHSTSMPDSEEKKATRRKGIEFINQHGAFEFLKTSTPNLFAQTTKDKSPALVTGFIESLSGFSADALIAYYEAMIKRPDRSGLLSATGLPVLFVFGEYDTVIPINDGLKLVTLSNKAYVHILHQSGHMGMIEEKEEASKHLSDFLNDI